MGKGEAKTEKSREQVVKDLLKDTSGNFVNTLNRIYYRKLPITEIEFVKQNRCFRVWLDLSNYSKDITEEIDLSVLWDSMRIIKECSKAIKIFQIGLIQRMPRYASTYVDIEDNKIKNIEKFLLNYGYPYPVTDEDIESLCSREDTRKVRVIDVNLDDLILSLHKIDEAFLIYMFLIAKEKNKETFNEIFCKHIERYGLFFEYYKKNGYSVLMERLYENPFIPILKQTPPPENRLYYHLISESPIAAAFHHMLFLISNNRGKRIKRCKNCNEFFEYTHGNMKYCGRLGCDRQSYYNHNGRKKK